MSLARLFDNLKHSYRVSMCGINYDGVGTCTLEHVNTLYCIGFHTYGCCHQKAAFSVFGCDRIVLDFHEVLVGDQADELSVGIHHRKFFEFMVAEDGGRFRKADALWSCYEVLRCHHH